MTTSVIILAALCLLALVAWDSIRRVLSFKASEASRALSELNTLVARNEAATERNSAALTNFLSQVMEVTNFVERERRTAVSAALKNTGKQFK